MDLFTSRQFSFQFFFTIHIAVYNDAWDLGVNNVVQLPYEILCHYAKIERVANITSNRKEKFQPRISIKTDSLPIEIEGDFCHFKVYKYWNTIKVKGLESEWDTKSIELNLCLADVEFYNLTSDELCIEGNLQIIDSQSYSHELVWQKIPEKYIYFESIGTWVSPHVRKRGIVAFTPLKKGLTISKIVRGNTMVSVGRIHLNSKTFVINF